MAAVIRGNTCGVRHGSNRLQHLRRKREPLRLKGPRPQPPCTEIARDQGADHRARRVAVLGDTGVQSRDLLDAFRIAAGLRGAGGNLIAKGLGFLNRGAGLHDGAIGDRPRHPLPEGAGLRWLIPSSPNPEIPAPIPRIARPPETSSSVAIAIAVNAGWRENGSVTQGPRRTFEVWPAKCVKQE